MKLPSLYSPERMRRRWLVLGEFAKYAFSLSGQKSRVCVNTLDRLLPPNSEQTFFCIFPVRPKPPTIPQKQPIHANTDSFPRITRHYPTPFPVFFIVFLPFSGRHQKLVVESPSLNSPERSEGDGWC